MKKLLSIFLLLVTCYLLLVAPAHAQSNIYLTLFYSKSCPHCHAEQEFLHEIETKYPWLKITEYEVGNQNNIKLFIETAKKLDIQASSVPVTLICDEYFVGFQDTKEAKAEIEQMLQNCQSKPCPDVVGEIIKSQNLKTNPSHTPQPDPTPTPSPNQVISSESSSSANSIICNHQEKCDCQNPDQCPHLYCDHQGQDCTCAPKNNLTQVLEKNINIPILGTRQLKDFSLPVLTFVIALLDGFNPCAMWVLLFLISMLLGMKDKKRMWILGTAFIITSAFVYFLFLSAWLNMFLFIGYIKAVQIGIGIFALGAGIYYLHDYKTNKEGACKVTGNKKRQKTFEKIKNITQNQNFFLALGGIIILAFAVNLVELLCSAGLPAIYTQVLTLSNLPTAHYYLYLAGYILIFMIDDLIIFFVAMFTLQTTGLSSKYSRYSHLIGGILMLLIGLAMVFKPELLMFG